MSLKCGIIGLPNVGKSTLFNALANTNVSSANYPFCTIEPNSGLAMVKDIRIEKIADIVDPQKIIPATVEFTDIAGLVKGASRGEGLGNKFLTNIKQTDALVHVVRCFDDADIVHVGGKISPIDDIETINTELILADLEQIERSYKKVVKYAKSANKKEIALKILLEKIQAVLARGDILKMCDFNENERVVINSLQLLTTKKMLYVANINEDGLVNNRYLDEIIDYTKQQQSVLITVCANIEADISGLSSVEKQEFLEEIGQKETGLDRLVVASYKLLGLQTYFTAGKKEVRAWTINIGDNAKAAAAKIHSDFATGFIRVETVSYDDFIKCRGEKAAKEAGLVRSEGKDYIVNDGDILHFLFNN